MGRSEDEANLRRQALQVAVQLPADTARALRVLKLAEDLVVRFLETGGDERGAQAAQLPTGGLRVV